MRNALTIDVEEYFQAHAYAKVIDRTDWEGIPARVVANVRRLLALFGEHGTRATSTLHPWEFDPEEPVVPRAPLLWRVRHRLNLGRTETRLRRLLGEHPFGPLCEVFVAELGQA